MRLAPLARATADDPTDGFTLDPNLDTIVQGPEATQDTASAMAEALVTRLGSVDLVIGPMALLDAAAATPQGQQRQLEARAAIEEQQVRVVAAWSDDDGRAVAEDLCQQEALAEALAAIGLAADCEAAPMGENEAGFLYQVRERVSG
ncbi:MAG: hypothetical protein R2711_08835 [Acidimicrobiales bacterium]